MLHQLLASDCYDGGPHVGIEVLGKEGGGFRRIRATVSGKAKLSTLVSDYRLRTTTKVDGLHTIEQSGSIIEPVPGTYFPTLLTAFQSAYNASNYIVTYEVGNPVGLQQRSGGATTALTDSTCSYRISAVQLASPLPTGGSVTVVDGEVTLRTDRDEQQRLTTVYDYSLQLKVTGSPSYGSLVTALTPSGSIIKQKVDFSSIKAWKLNVSFTVLSSNDGDGLLEFAQTISVKTAATTYEQYTYAGISPIAVARPAVFARISQSGSMMGLGDFLAAPGPVIAYHADQPEFTYVDVSNYEKRTEWKYNLLDVDGVAGADLVSWLAGIARPVSVTVLGP
jgi:hypothetical protein